MNFLAHHTLARRALPDAPDSFFVGNLLPDLAAIYGAGRLRRFPEIDSETSDDSPLLAGIRFHFATDRAFHASPAFTDACADASRLFRDAPFDSRPARIFFWAHVAVELCLDHVLWRNEPNLVDDLYGRFANTDAIRAIAREISLSAPNVSSETIESALWRFPNDGFLRRYDTLNGLAGTLDRIARRANLSPLSDGDRAVLSTLVGRIVESIGDGSSLLSAGEVQ